MNLKRSLRSPLRPAALSPLQHALIAGGVTAPPGTPAFTITLDNLVGLTGGGTTNVFMTGSSGGGGVVVAKSSASRLTGVAPLYVNFDATETTSTLSSNPSHELFFAHDFGDTGAGTWANGVQSSGLTSKNAGYGPVTGHVYETPGTYTYTMAVTDGVNTATRTKTIVVQDPNAVYAGALTICISHSGNFTGAPSGATQITAGSDDMYAAWNTHKASNKRILFCKADSWTCSATITFNNLTNTTLSGYGTGAARSVKFGATSDTLVSVTPSALAGGTFTVQSGVSGLRVHNFKITANANTLGAYVLETVDGVLFSKVEVRGCPGGFSAYMGGTVAAAKYMDQLCLYECLVDDLDAASGTGGIGAFVSLVRGGVMGCYFDSQGRGEQVLRFPYLSRAHINNNYAARPNKTKNVLKVHSFIYDAATIWSEKFIITGNEMDLRGGYSYNGTTVTAVGTPSMVIGSGGNGGIGGEWVRNGIVENNITHSCLGNHVDSFAFAEINCPNMTVRNNIADFAQGDRSTAYSGPYAYTHLYFVSVATSTADRTIGVRVYNNTLYSNLANAETAFFCRISSGGANPVPDQITIKNNIWYTPFHPNANRTVKYDDLGLATNVVTSNNTDTVAGSSVTPAPGFVAQPPVLLADWRPNTGSYAINSGATVPVLRDFNNVTRVGGTYDLGAVLP